ncbi:MAG: hypothetical protein ACH349_00710 [Candidatus Rhabdochlamydia sp.]|jgi:hypothetical protein|nr:hypothetical protein [Chlamydiota bacterium]
MSISNFLEKSFHDAALGATGAVLSPMNGAIYMLAQNSYLTCSK